MNLFISCVLLLRCNLWFGLRVDLDDLKVFCLGCFLFNLVDAAVFVLTRVLVCLVLWVGVDLCCCLLGVCGLHRILIYCFVFL